MTNPVKSLWKWMTNQQDKRQNLGVPLDNIDYEKYKAMIQENSALKGQIGLYLAEQKEVQESEKDRDKEQEIIKDLNKQGKDILKSLYGNTVSLAKFYQKYFRDSRFRDRLELTDKDDHEIFGKFGDIRIITDGRYAGYGLIVDSHNNPVKLGRSFDELIYKPETFGNQLKRGRILLPVDSGMNPVRDLEQMEVSDIKYNEDDGTYSETEEYRIKVKDLIIKYIKEIRDKSQYIERLELMQVEQNREMNDLRRSLNVLKNQSQVAQTELSEAMGLTMQFNSKIGDQQRKIASLTDIKVLYENLLDKKDDIIKKVLDKLEQYGDKTVYEITKAEVQGDLEFYKAMLPEQVTQIMPSDEKKIPVYPPGTDLGVTGKDKGR